MNTTSIVLAILGSNALFTFITFLITRHDNKRASKDTEMRRQSDMLMGLGHDRIMTLGMNYIDRGYVTKEEYDDFVKYLYTPYIALGGNGTAEKLMREIERLELRK